MVAVYSSRSSVDGGGDGDDSSGDGSSTPPPPPVDHSGVWLRRCPGTNCSLYITNE